MYLGFSGGSDRFCVLCALRDHIELSLATSGRILSPRKLVDNLNRILLHDFIQFLYTRYCDQLLKKIDA